MTIKVGDKLPGSKFKIMRGGEMTDLTSEAKKLVGAGGRLQEYYLSAQFAPLGIPVQLRVGNQVINWGTPEGGSGAMYQNM